MRSKIPDDDTLQRLVDITNQTCLVALGKTLAHAYRTRPYAVAALKTKDIGERMVRALQEVRMTLPRK